MTSNSNNPPQDFPEELDTDFITFDGGPLPNRVILEWTSPEGKRTYFASPIAAPASQPDLNANEQYRLQMAGISTAALGYWKEGDSVHPDYDTPALRDVAKLYAKYAELYENRDQPDDAVNKKLDEMENAADMRGYIGFRNRVKELRTLLATSQPDAAAIRRQAPQEQQEQCVCGEPESSGTVHRTDGPCYVAAPVAQQAGQPAPAVPEGWKRKLKKMRDGMQQYLKDHTHHAPDDCYATGPKTGDEFFDLVRCPACCAEKGFKEAISAIDNMLAAPAQEGKTK